MYNSNISSFDIVDSTIFSRYALAERDPKSAADTIEFPFRVTKIARCGRRESRNSLSLIT